MEDLTGLQLGPYRIVAALGAGGMAAVYKAYQPSMDRYVAIKILPRQLALYPEFVGRFQCEARLIAKLVHPHILPVHDFGQAEGYMYLVTPFVEGCTLAQWLTGRPLPLPQVVDVIAHLADALDYAHSRGIVHRDIKPGNVLIDQRQNCLLTDFGLDQMVKDSARFTQTGTAIGTPAYMSPEQGRGEKVDQRSDIYSLGVVLYEMTTGRVPFDAPTPVEIVTKHIQAPLPPARIINPEWRQAMPASWTGLRWNLRLQVYAGRLVIERYQRLAMNDSE